MKVSEQSQATELAVVARIRGVIDDGRTRVAAIVQPACPTITFLTALASELQQAAADPASVAYPELVDPDKYWEAAVKPQSQSVRRSCLQVAENIETRLAALLPEAEAELSARIDAFAISAKSAKNMAAARSAAIDDVAEQCQRLHHQLAGLLTVLPSGELVEAAEHAIDAARRDRATTDVDSLKAAYLKEAGGNEEHQAFAEQQWSETFSARVSHRDAMLRASSPWRHQELAVVGHVRARQQIEEALETAVARLQAPLVEIGERLVSRFDSALG